MLVFSVVVLVVDDDPETTEPVSPVVRVKQRLLSHNLLMCSPEQNTNQENWFSSSNSGYYNLEKFSSNKSRNMEAETGGKDEEDEVDEEGGRSNQVDEDDYEEDGAGDHGVPENCSYPLRGGGKHIHHGAGALRSLVIRPPVGIRKSISRGSRIL